jgi:hypothetical protein
MAEKIQAELRNQYNSFRGVGSSFLEFTDTIRKISSSFDEPTYYTFKMFFYSDDDRDNAATNVNFDRMPQPLFSNQFQRQMDARNYYSTAQYLWDMDEEVRFQMIQEFKAKWNQLQEQYQWYFQSISGLNSLMSVVPGRGKRVAQDARITVKTLEGLDQKITYLLNLYRKIAWDDDYQRWILPDMMRYFRITIYITEFRTFHRSNFVANSEVNQDTGQRFSKGLEENQPMIMSIIQNMTPLYVLDLERCEFDLESFNLMPDSINVGEAEMRELEFGIKVGNFKERYINPIFNTILSDLMINGFGRTAQTAESIRLTSNPQKASEGAALIGRAHGDSLATSSHQSGKPFVQTGNIDNIHNADPNYDIDVQSVNPVQPSTWLGNTLTLGKTLVKNLVESKIDEFKIMKIPGLGISFNEALAAIQSKNVFTLFGAIRKAFSDSVAGTLPSKQLEEGLIDTQFKDFLKGVSQSEATDGDAVELIKAANLILSDQGKWEEIKDLSKATNLVGTALGEINTPAVIEGATTLRTLYASQVNVIVPVQDGMVFEGLPTSTATISKLEGKKLQQPLPGKATEAGSVQVERSQSADLGSTDGTLPGGFQPLPSSKLGKDPGASLPQPESGLGSNAGESLSQPDSGLGTNAGESLSSSGSGLGNKIDGKLNLPEPGEAVDGDPIEAKPLPLPEPSKATHNKLQQ